MKPTLIAFALFASAASAYEPGTHSEISAQAADQSHLNDILRDRFGHVFGLEEVVYGIRARNWIAAGGFLEDSPGSRGVNHFHQPLDAWAIAGLAGFNSSIYWQQDSFQGIEGGGTWSWPEMRKEYAKYLLATNPADGDLALSHVLRGIGQMAHLVQDATSPAHTRRDPHLIWDGYEKRIEALRVGNPLLFFKLLQGAPVRPDPAIFTPTGSFFAPARIARLIDSDTYAGDPGSYGTSGLVGASEYTNGGYVSDDTIFRSFSMPRRESLAPDGFYDAPLTGISQNKRHYFVKVSDGDMVTHFVAEGTLWSRLWFTSSFAASYVLDDWTYADAASFLMRRAVGYSAALYDYFFREQLEIAAPDKFVYGRALYQPTHPELGFGQFLKLRAKVRNATPGEAMGAGTLTGVLRYRRLVGSGGVSGTDSFKEPSSPITIAYEQAVSQPVPVASVGSGFVEKEFDFSQSPIPVNAVDVRLLVVFQGPVGEESSAVAVGIKDLKEPDPIDYVNGTDWECYQGQLYHVADTTLFPPGSFAARDVDGDNIVDLFAPYFEVNMNFKTSDLSQISLPSNSLFDMHVPSIDGSQGSQTARAVILQDQDSYAAAARDDAIGATFGGPVPPPLALFAFRGIVNAVITLPFFGTVHAYTQNATYRGKIGFHGVVLVTEGTLDCFPQTADLKPDTTLIDSPPEVLSP